MSLQDRTTDLNLGKPRKNVVSGNVKCLRLDIPEMDKSAQVNLISSLHLFYASNYSPA